jgi:hypothetical protein
MIRRLAHIAVVAATSGWLYLFCTHPFATTGGTIGAAYTIARATRHQKRRR